LDARFVAVGHKQTVLTSVDGIDWKLEHMDATKRSERFERIAYDGNVYVVCSSNERILYVSTDLATWTPAVLPPAERTSQMSGFKDLLHAGDRFAALYVNGTVLYSLDGLTWEEGDIGSSNVTKKLAYGNGTFVAALSDGSLLYTKPAAVAESETAEEAPME
jgi:hypothetical protein